jgi:superfamily I DNA/RNA helicase
VRFVVAPNAKSFMTRLRDSIVASAELRRLIETTSIPIVENPVGPDRLELDIAVLSDETRLAVKFGIGGLLATGGLRSVWAGDEPAYEIGDLSTATRLLTDIVDHTQAVEEGAIEIGATPDLLGIAREVVRSICNCDFIASELNRLPDAPSGLSSMIELDAQQRRAVNVSSDSDLLINAAAGSGKTHTLAHRIAHLVEECGWAAERCVVLTFSVAARRQIQGRLQSFASAGHPRLAYVDARTLHSMAYRILAIAARLRLTRFRPRFSIVDEASERTERGGLIHAPSPFIENYDAIFSDLNDGLTRPERIGLYSAAINALRNGHPSLGVVFDPDALRDDGEITVVSARNGQLRELEARNVRRVWSRYESVLAEGNAIDLGGLSAEALKAIRNHSTLANLIVSTYAVAFIDEYQDTTRAQDELLLTFAQGGMLLNAVGDGDQTITSFAGAHAGNISDFATHVRERAGRSVEVCELETNYRSRPEVVALASSVVARNTQRLPKKMRAADASESEFGHVYRIEGDLRHLGPWIALRVNALLSSGVQPEQIAVLYRKEAENSPQKSSVIEHLRSQGIAASEDEEDLFSLRILTIHRAKGLEFDHVFVLFLAPRDFPDPRGDAEEERRLLYVAARVARCTSAGSPERILTCSRKLTLRRLVHSTR